MNVITAGDNAVFQYLFILFQIFAPVYAKPETHACDRENYQIKQNTHKKLTDAH